MSIEVKNLYFSYQSPLLNDINLKVNKGEIVGVLGPNGCGKSTLIKNILKILTPQRGSIMCCNKPIESYTHKELARLIGFVPQKSGLNMPLSVEDLLFMGRFSSMNNSFWGYSKEDREIVDEIAEILCLTPFMKRLALSLSGGEFQRVLLGRALVGKPKILLLDEPTSALDMNYAIDIMKICERYVSAQNLSGLVVLHDLNLAALFCHRVILMQKGKICYNGHVRDVFTSEILHEIYGFDCDIILHNNYPFVAIKK